MRNSRNIDKSHSLVKPAGTREKQRDFLQEEEEKRAETVIIPVLNLRISGRGVSYIPPGIPTMPTRDVPIYHLGYTIMPASGPSCTTLLLCYATVQASMLWALASLRERAEHLCADTRAYPRAGTPMRRQLAVEHE